MKRGENTSIIRMKSSSFDNSICMEISSPSKLS
jgi:hypothetical protein